MGTQLWMQLNEMVIWNDFVSFCGQANASKRYLSNRLMQFIGKYEIAQLLKDAETVPDVRPHCSVLQKATHNSVQKWLDTIYVIPKLRMVEHLRNWQLIKNTYTNKKSLAPSGLVISKFLIDIALNMWNHPIKSFLIVKKSCRQYLCLENC